MRIALTSDKAAVVDLDNHYIEIEKTPPPIGPLMLLINHRQGIAKIDTYRPGEGWYTHWYPLPKFKRS